MTRTALALTLLATMGCQEPDYMTAAEALEALDESNSSARGEQATAEPIEISTDATIGDAVEEAAQNLADFWASQIDCTVVTLEGATVTVDYGTLDDACVYDGNTYAGVTKVTVGSSTPGDLLVTHEWLAFTNGELQVDGGAEVTWSGNDGTRRVVTEHTWTDSSEAGADGGPLTVDVEGDHVQAYIDETQKILGGIVMDGTRQWFSDSGDWSLDMTGLELRLQDPAPQAGVLDLTNPDGKHLTIEYSRVDNRTIQAVLTGTREPLVFHINLLGIPTEVDEPVDSEGGTTP